MSTRLPQVLVYDSTKQHHVAVLVDRLDGTFSYMCAECDADLIFPIEELEALRGYIRNHPSCQVVLWAETDG